MDMGSYYLFSVSNSNLDSTAKFTPWPYEVNLNQLVGNRRENIPNATLAVHLFSDPKQIPYATIYKIINDNNFRAGPEIFILWKYVLQDLGSESAVFRDLPRIVQTVLLEHNLSWTFCQFSSSTCDADGFQMKYSFASDVHTNIQPFHFRFSNYSQSPVGISYAGTHNLFINQNQELGHVISQDPPSKLFQLHLTEDETHIQIGVVGDTRYLETENESPEFYFKTGYSIIRTAEFKLDKY